MGKLEQYDKERYCTLDEYAAHYGVTTRTAYNHFYAGRMVGAFKDTGATNRILIPIEYIRSNPNPRVTVYATVSVSEQDREKMMEDEVLKLRRYCAAKGYKVTEIIKEYSYGIFDERPKLLKLLKNRYVKHIVVSSKNAVNRFSFDFVSAIMEADGRELEYMTVKESDDSVFKKDFLDTIYVVCKKLGTKEVTYEDVRRSMVSLGIVDRKKVSKTERRKNETDAKTSVRTDK